MKIKLFLTYLTLLLSSTEVIHCFASDTSSNNPQKAIVIGASSGMGREVAKLLSHEGYIVGLVARRLPLLESLQAELLQPTYIKDIDVTHQDARQHLASLITDMNGIDLIVISISPYLDNGCSLDTTWEAKERIIDVCAKGFIAMADVALEFFMKQGHGHLVGISSTSGLRGSSISPEYSAAKACIDYYMEGKRNYMIQNNINIQVTNVIPGYVAVEHSLLGTDPAAYWEITVEQAGKIILEGIKKKKKIVYVPPKAWIIACALKYLPDFIYNRYFAWL